MTELDSPLFNKKQMFTPNLSGVVLAIKTLFGTRFSVM